MPVNYQNGKIYKIESLIGNCTYYGSTTKKYLCDRLSGHVYAYKKNENITSSKVLQYPDAKIELVELYPCNSKDELNKREGYYIKNNDCVNKYIAGRTDKQYCIDNKESISQKKKVYRDNNKELLSLQCKKWKNENKERITECGKKYYENNKEKISQKSKLYYQNNKEKIKEHAKQNYINNKEKILTRINKQCICECGNTYTRINKTKHLKSHHHIKYMSNPFYNLHF